MSEWGGDRRGIERAEEWKLNFSCIFEDNRHNCKHGVVDQGCHVSQPETGD